MVRCSHRVFLLHALVPHVQSLTEGTMPLDLYPGSLGPHSPPPPPHFPLPSHLPVLQSGEITALGLYSVMTQVGVNMGPDVSPLLESIGADWQVPPSPPSPPPRLILTLMITREGGGGGSSGAHGTQTSQDPPNHPPPRPRPLVFARRM